MSVIEACTTAFRAVDRARSLFGGDAAVPPATAQALAAAAQTCTAAGLAMSGVSGAAVAAYRPVVFRATTALAAAGTTDTDMHAQTTAAAQVARSGALRLDQIAAQTREIAQAAPAATTPAAQRAILLALRAQVSSAGEVVSLARNRDAKLANQLRGLRYPPADLSGHAQQLGRDIPRAPANDDDPPHGKDPRYWIDVTKIIGVPEGQLAPANTTQIGPGLFYPAPDMPGFATPPPPPAKWPLDLSDIVHVAPGQLGPSNSIELAPGIFAPTPSTLNPEQPWSPPQSPVDVRDIIQVPKGQLAPWGYREYLPGWWAPDPAASGPLLSSSTRPRY
jgi:hypothetical protein